MKITYDLIREAVREAIKEIGTMDAADYYGPQDEEDNVLDLLDDLKLNYVRAGKRKLAKAIATASMAIENGNLDVADQVLVFIFKTGGKNRAVYHAIAYIRELMGK